MIVGAVFLPRTAVMPEVSIPFFWQIQLLAHGRQKTITSRGQNEKHSARWKRKVTETMKHIPDAQRELYQTEGYMILPGVIPPAMLEMLREECSYYLGYYDSMMDAKGVQSEGISH